MQTICSHCSKSFEIKPYRLQQAAHVFCSRKCKGAYLTAHGNPKRARQVKVICSTCKKEFSKNQYWASGSSNHYCSRKCYDAWQRTGTKKGKPRMGRAPAGPENHNWKGGHKKYRGPNWGRQSKAARQRDSDTCQHCGVQRKGLQVHHERPFHLFDSYLEANQLSNLITLCNTCHGKAEYAFWSAHPELVSKRVFADCSLIKTCEKCNKEYSPNSPIQKLCDQCRTARCPCCGVEFRRATRKQLQVYCSKKCADKMIWHSRKPCQGCGKQMPRADSSRAFCSKECKARYFANTKTRLLQGYKLDESTGCWLWQGRTLANGVGVICVDGRDCHVHRIAAKELTEWKLTPQQRITHTCGNKACINPAHLKLKTGNVQTESCQPQQQQNNSNRFKHG